MCIAGPGYKFGRTPGTQPTDDHRIVMSPSNSGKEQSPVTRVPAHQSAFCRLVCAAEYQHTRPYQLPASSINGTRAFGIPHRRYGVARDSCDKSNCSGLTCFRFTILPRMRELSRSDMWGKRQFNLFGVTRACQRYHQKFLAVSGAKSLYLFRRTAVAQRPASGCNSIGGRVSCFR